VAAPTVTAHGQQPRTPAVVHTAWKIGRKLSQRDVDLILRFAPRCLLASTKPRLAGMGLPERAVDDALNRVRALAQWSPVWTWTAQRFLADGRQARAAGNILDEAAATRQAALAYAVAAWMPGAGAKELRTLRAAASGLFARSLPVIDPATEPIAIPWRTTTLPGYLVRPPDLEGRLPLVVLLNGMTTCKEEMLSWIEPLLWQGMAVLALDWPGTGEAALRAGPDPDCDDLADGVFSFVEADPALDLGRVAFVGVSLGATIATRIAAADRRVAAAVAVTPPFDARPWLPIAGPLLRFQLEAFADNGTSAELAAGFALTTIAERVRTPMLVLGAGRDLMVPPAEALRLASAVGASATLLWYAEGHHALFNLIPLWTADVASWLSSVFGPPSTRVDDEGDFPLRT
jgi:alpha-beta hydrolase superfamily lysophospholipase